LYPILEVFFFFFLASFYILSKRQSAAFEDLTVVITNEEASPKLRVNALIKRASLYIQRCRDPKKDPELAFADFAIAASLEPENADIYHHRGQVSCSFFSYVIFEYMDSNHLYLFTRS